MDLKEARRLHRKVCKERADEAIQQRVRLALLINRGKVSIRPEKSSTFSNKP